MRPRTVEEAAALIARASAEGTTLRIGTTSRRTASPASSSTRPAI